MLSTAKKHRAAGERGCDICIGEEEEKEEKVRGKEEEKQEEEKEQGRQARRTERTTRARSYRRMGILQPVAKLDLRSHRSPSFRPLFPPDKVDCKRVCR